MPADQTAAHSDDRSRHCLTLAASAQPNGKCGRVVRISRWRSTNLSPIRATITAKEGGRATRSRNLAPSISMLRLVAEGAGS